MKIFNGKYSWDGKKHDNQEPIAWFPGAYNLKIVDLAGYREKQGALSQTLFLRRDLVVGQRLVQPHLVPLGFPLDLRRHDRSVDHLRRAA